VVVLSELDPDDVPPVPGKRARRPAVVVGMIRRGHRESFLAQVSVLDVHCYRSSAKDIAQDPVLDSAGDVRPVWSALRRIHCFEISPRWTPEPSITERLPIVAKTRGIFVAVCPTAASTGIPAGSGGVERRDRG
jgi:hypothetical protein